MTKRFEIASELVANVQTVHVTPGQEIAAGDEVVLLESMKMDIPLLSESAGTVVEVNCAVGDVVQEGDVLVVVEG